MNKALRQAQTLPPQVPAGGPVGRAGTEWGKYLGGEGHPDPGLPVAPSSAELRRVPPLQGRGTQASQLPPVMLSYGECLHCRAEGQRKKTWCFCGQIIKTCKDKCPRGDPATAVNCTAPEGAAGAAPLSLPKKGQVLTGRVTWFPLRAQLGTFSPSLA